MYSLDYNYSQPLRVTVVYCSLDSSKIGVRDSGYRLGAAAFIVTLFGVRLLGGYLVRTIFVTQGSPGDAGITWMLILRLFLFFEF